MIFGADSFLFVIEVCVFYHLISRMGRIIVYMKYRCFVCNISYTMRLTAQSLPPPLWKVCNPCHATRSVTSGFGAGDIARGP